MSKVRKVIDEANESKNPELDLVDLKLSSFDEIPGICKLHSVSMTNIFKFKHYLYSNIVTMYNLTRITLTHNKISAVPPALANLNNLEILNLFNNQITELPTSLSSMPKLRILNLGYYQL